MNIQVFPGVTVISKKNKQTEYSSLVLTKVDDASKPHCYVPFPLHERQHRSAPRIHWDQKQHEAVERNHWVSGRERM